MKLGKETRIALAAVVMIALLAVVYLLLPKGGGEDSVVAPVVVSQAEYDRGLAGLDAVRVNLLAARSEVGRQMQSIIVAKGNDEAAIAADPEWRRLNDLLVRLDAEYEAVRLDMLNFRKTRTVTGANNEEGIPQ